MEQPSARGVPGTRRTRQRNRPRRRDQPRESASPQNQPHESAAPQFSFARHSSGALGASPPPNPLGLLSERGASVSSRAGRAGQQSASPSGRRVATGETRGGRGRPPLRGGLGSRGQRGGRRPQETLPPRPRRTGPDSLPGKRPPGSDGPRESGRHDRSAPAGHTCREDGDRQPSFSFRGGRRSLTRAVPFPSFAEITAAGEGRRNDVGPLSEKSVLCYVYNCYIHALSTSAKATLSSFRLVPDRGLGRVVRSSRCCLPSLCGTAVAFCDPESEYICYGEIVTQGTEHVALLYDRVGVTGEQERHEFFLVNLNLDGSCFVSHLTALCSKSPDDLRRVESLLSGEMRQSLGEQGVHDRGAMPSARGAPDYKQDGAASADESRTAAVTAALTSDRSVLIHAPFGTGDKELLKAAVHLTLSADVVKRHGSVLIAGSELAPLFKDDMDGICDLDAEIGNAENATEESASAIESKGKINECFLRISEALQELCTVRTTIVHQSRFEGITRNFSSKRSEGRNCIEPWLFFGIKRKDMEASVSAADFDEYRDDYEHMFKGYCGPPSSTRSIGFSYERAPQASQTAEAVNGTVKSVYIWKTLRATRAELSDVETTNCSSLDGRHRWKLYKRWILCLEENVFEKLEDAQNELLHCKLRCTKMLSEHVASQASGAPLIVSKVATAITHATVTDALRPKALVLFRAHQFPSFLAASLFSQSMDKLVLIGDNLCPQSTLAPSLWSFAFNSECFELHELSLQPLLSQAVCNLLAPFTKNVLESCSTVEAVKGIGEQTQFFDIPDEDEAFSLMSRLCLHLQTHGYEPGDVAVVSLSPNAGAPALVQKLRDLRCAHVVWAFKDFYPGWCKILVLYIGTGSLGADLVAALSRARCAVYGFGRLSSADESCQNVFNTFLEGRQRRHPFLSVSCVRHPGTVVRIESVRDFESKFRETGACNEPCGAKRCCGHRCAHRCHEGGHPGLCYEHCSKTVCSRKHPCSNRCYERCTQHCRVDVTATLPYCTHTATFPCCTWSAQCPSRDGPHQYKCTMPVTVRRNCGHAAQVSCFQSRSVEVGRTYVHIEQRLNLPPCRENVQVTPPCGHSKTILCCNKASYKCSVTVMVERSCGHTCYVSCGDDRIPLPLCTATVQVFLDCGHTTYRKCSRTISPKCTAVVKRTLACGHTVDAVCSSASPLCSVPVSKTLPCGHVQIKVCHDNSSPCTRPCNYRMHCSHFCSLRCGVHPHEDKCQSCKDKCCVS